MVNPREPIVTDKDDDDEKKKERIKKIKKTLP